MNDETNDDELDSDENVTYPITDELDLHTFRPSEVSALLHDYLEEAHAAGFRRVRIVHGKGTGTLKRGVLSFLSRHPRVRQYFDADVGSGSWGATIAILSDE